MSEMRARPEQTFFTDPAIDRIMGVLMSLAGEVYVLRDRMRVLEARLSEQGVLAPGALDSWTPTPEQAQATQADRDAFVTHLLDNLLGQQAARGPL